jgi:hypothetical protein
MVTLEDVRKIIAAAERKAGDLGLLGARSLSGFVACE